MQVTADEESDDSRAVRTARRPPRRVGEGLWGCLRRRCPCALRVLGQEAPTVRGLIILAYLVYLQVTVLTAAGGAGEGAAVRRVRAPRPDISTITQ